MNTISYRVDGFLGALTSESEKLFSNAADGSARGASITLPKGFYVVEWKDSLGQTAVGTTGDKNLSFQPSKGAGWKTTTYYAVVDGTVFDYNGNKKVENMDRSLFLRVKESYQKGEELTLDQYLLGDGNGDKRVNSVDYNLILRTVTNSNLVKTVNATQKR